MPPRRFGLGDVCLPCAGAEGRSRSSLAPHTLPRHHLAGLGWAAGLASGPALCQSCVPTLRLQICDTGLAPAQRTSGRCPPRPRCRSEDFTGAPSACRMLQVRRVCSKDFARSPRVRARLSCRWTQEAGFGLRPHGADFRERCTHMMEVSAASRARCTDGPTGAHGASKQVGLALPPL